MQALHKTILSLSLLALASCASELKTKQSAATTMPQPQTELRPMQINTQPQGAAILFNGDNVGYSPVTINVETVKSTGAMARAFFIQAIPTGPGQFTQFASSFMNLLLGGSAAQTPQSIILYMYQPTQAQ
jgi:hypothetical protein